MLVGEHKHSLDAKGRAIIPSKLRDEMGTKIVLTKGLDNCLFAYPLSEWQRVVEKLSQLSFTKADARAFARSFFSGAEEVDMDKQGRIPVTPNLRKHAGLDKEIIIIGVSNRIEIWDTKTWTAYMERADANYEEIAEKVTEWNLGI